MFINRVKMLLLMVVTIKTHSAFCQKLSVFIRLQLRQSITKHFTNHSMTTISVSNTWFGNYSACKSERPREVCKQPGSNRSSGNKNPYCLCMLYRKQNAKENEMQHARRDRGLQITSCVTNKAHVWEMQ